MSQLQYRNRSISQLVNQLNTLGDSNILLEPIQLLAVHSGDLQGISRYKNNNGDQFFVGTGSKKYYYDAVHPQLKVNSFSRIEELFGRGFNTGLVMVAGREQKRTVQVLGAVSQILGKRVACMAVELNDEGISDSISGGKVSQRECENDQKYYSVPADGLLTTLDNLARGQSSNSIKIIRLRNIEGSKLSNHCFSIVIFPNELHSPSLKASSYLGTTKSQLGQIFNYLKLNHQKRYQHFSKLLTKRLPSTNLIAHLILEEAACVLVNYVSGPVQEVQELFSFYDKFKGVSSFIKKGQERKETQLLDMPSAVVGQSSKSRSPLRTKPLPNSQTERTPISGLEQDGSQLQYCRSLERKTHKYSISMNQEEDEALFKDTPKDSSPVQHPTPKQFSPEPHFTETIPRQSTPAMQQSQAVAILKAQHAVEVSQYHQTIQQLNRKIMVLTNEKGLNELYSIHEKQIMLLQLKIKELRSQISSLCKGADEKTAKSMVRKLNEEVKRLENKNAEMKVTGSKMAGLERQVKQLRKKNEESESIRKKLTLELEYATKRLSIRDAEIESMYGKEGELRDLQADPQGTASKMSLSDLEALKEIEVLARNMLEGNDQARQFLIRKVTNTLTDLSGARDTILECNDFLVQLEEHLEERLGRREPQIVLDCNKFIRTFLMDNLNIF